MSLEKTLKWQRDVQIKISKKRPKLAEKDLEENVS